MNKEISLLSRAVNFAVVQLPERSFPGVVIQGDSLNELVRRVIDMSKLLGAGEAREVAAELDDIREELSGALRHYELVCKEQGIPLPYSKT